MQENHKKYSKLCVYWIGPFFPLVYTGDVETMKVFLHQSGGSYIAIFDCNNFYILLKYLMHRDS